MRLPGGRTTVPRPSLYTLLQSVVEALQSPTCKVLYTSNQQENWAPNVLSAMHEWLPPAKGVGQVHIMMVAGVPNVGKSTFINALKDHAFQLGLRAGKKSGRVVTGPLPGVTKQVLGFKVLFSSPLPACASKTALIREIRYIP